MLSKTSRASGCLELLSFELGEPEVEPGDGAVGTPVGLDRRWNPTAKLKSCRRDQERSSLWELVNTFVHRGMEGVFCEVVDETGSMRSGMYHIDVRLSNELFEDNVGPQASMSSSSVQMSTAQGFM